MPAATKIEVWFQDEARVGQKTNRTRRWATKGTRPTALVDQRFETAYIFGAICPARDVGAAIISPCCNTQAMNLHLAEIATQVEPGSHAVIILDQAAWHTTKNLELPPNISLDFLPPKCPELNPVENVWQFLRNLYLSNLIFEDYEALVDRCCSAWNALVNEDKRIQSIGQRDWL